MKIRDRKVAVRRRRMWDVVLWAVAAVIGLAVLYSLIHLVISMVDKISDWSFL